MGREWDENGIIVATDEVWGATREVPTLTRHIIHHMWVRMHRIITVWTRPAAVQWVICTVCLPFGPQHRSCGSATSELPPDVSGIPAQSGKAWLCAVLPGLECLGGYVRV